MHTGDLADHVRHEEPEPVAAQVEHLDVTV